MSIDESNYETDVIDLTESINCESSMKFENNINFIDNDDDNSSNDMPGPITERWDPLGAASDSNGTDNLPLTDLNQISTTNKNFYNNKNYEMNEMNMKILDDTAMDKHRLRSLEDEQEILTQSLMALTSHFAQVQFRLRQIVESPSIERDKLLKSLEEFAFRGIPEIEGFDAETENDRKFPIDADLATNSIPINQTDNQMDVIIETEQQRQFDLIHRLKRQLTDLEKFAYDSGAPVLPQSILLEKQKIIIDELKTKLNLNVKDIDLPQLTTEDLKQHVDAALIEFTGPLKMKEQLVAQLKTQITDLERFIAYLQCSEDGQLQTDEFQSKLFPNWLRDKVKDKKCDAYNTYSAKKKAAAVSKSKTNSESSTPNSDTKSKKFTKFSYETEDLTEKQQKATVNASSEPKSSLLNQKANNLLDKAATLLQIVAVTQFGCSTSNNQFNKNTLKKTKWGNHWGDIRAQLELDIQEIIGLTQAIEQFKQNFGKQENTDSNKFVIKTQLKNMKKQNNLSLNIELTTLIRKNFSCTLQKLMQHGLKINLNKNPANNLIVPFMGCFNGGNLANINSINNFDESNILSGSEMHAWELILEYYKIKDGDDYNSTPARKLSQSFNLDIISGNSTKLSNKESLLSCIGNIIHMHQPYKRSYNSLFKAFICAGLNENKLVQWLSLILHCNNLIDEHYEPWSYIKRTGFNDALHSIDLLTKYNFELPIDLAVRQFENIKDIFM